MVVAEQDAIALNEIQEVWHLLQVGGDIRDVARKVGIVKLYKDHVLDVAVCRLELAIGRGENGTGLGLGERLDSSVNGGCGLDGGLEHDKREGKKDRSPQRAENPLPAVVVYGW